MVNTCAAELFAFLFIQSKMKLLKQFPASNDKNYIDRKGIPPGPDQGEYPSYLCTCSLQHLKLTLLTQFPDSNDENIYIYDLSPVSNYWINRLSIFQNLSLFLLI